MSLRSKPLKTLFPVATLKAPIAAGWRRVDGRSPDLFVFVAARILLIAALRTAEKALSRRSFLTSFFTLCLLGTAWNCARIR
jgi:hypothetical protein